LEAFALKCPVIAADVSGAKEQLGDAALLVDPSDPKTIAAAIREMSNNPARRKDLVSAGSKIADKWRTKDFVEGALKIIDLMATK
jgi:glycosyltransferase involved in cell wall biosynthesis